MNFDEWTKNTVLTCLAHNKNVLVLRMAHPGSMVNSETITMSHVDGPVNSIAFNGDGGSAIITPTWDPLQVTDYREFSLGYFMEKLSTAGKDIYTWNADDKITDFEDLAEDDYSENEYEYLRSVANNSEYDDGELVAMMEYQYVSDIDGEVVEDAIRLGRRLSGRMQLYFALLQAISELGDKPWKLKTGEEIIIGDPDQWHW